MKKHPAKHTRQENLSRNKVSCSPLTSLLEKSMTMVENLHSQRKDQGVGAAAAAVAVAAAVLIVVPAGVLLYPRRILQMPRQINHQPEGQKLSPRKAMLKQQVQYWMINIIKNTRIKHMTLVNFPRCLFQAYLNSKGQFQALIPNPKPHGCKGNKSTQRR